MISFKMGNEESHNSNIDFESDAVEVTDNWTLYNAYNFNGSAIVRSAFISQQETLDCPNSPLQRLAKNLMIHRHPCIVQYISSWGKYDSFYLITEEVKPLAQVIGTQSALQICVGLHSILRALTFLHDKAQSSHNNLCCDSIYVTPEGVWKLGGLDYLMKFSDVTYNYLQENRIRRYEKAIAPEENKCVSISKINAEAIDQYAFGVLVEEVLEKKTNDEVPHLVDFKAFCQKNLHAVDPLQRCKLSEVMSHQFFKHDFIRIHTFLSELPLKVGREKEEFFRDLTVQLSVLPEEIVASQLSSLLLSRMVILDEAAQHHFLPVILHPKTGNGNEAKSLFSEDSFKKYVVPKLLQMFCVHDAQVRLVLLSNFNLFCKIFTTEQLKHQVLPELLIGIKDLNDELVSMTLKALADLVLILGSSTVIGGKRGKLFTDGRPKPHNSPGSGANTTKLKETDKKIKTSSHTVFYTNELPERLSPDGGEDNISTTTVEEIEVDNENWSDWESPKEGKPNESEAECESIGVNVTHKKSTGIVTSGFYKGHQNLSDISALDIKYNAGSSREKAESAKENDCEIDFFRDMEPVISKTQSLDIYLTTNKFDMNLDAEDVGGEWDGGWALEDENESV